MTDTDEWKWIKLCAAVIAGIGAAIALVTIGALML
jgi:uncharacterized protein involved in exopolysaccharide biosynthesis